MEETITDVQDLDQEQVTIDQPKRAGFFKRNQNALVGTTALIGSAAITYGAIITSYNYGVARTNAAWINNAERPGREVLTDLKIQVARLETENRFLKQAKAPK